MFWDKFFKKRSADKNIVNGEQEAKGKTDADSDMQYNISQKAYDNIDIDFVTDNRSEEDILKDLNLNPNDIDPIDALSFDTENTDELVRNMLDEADDIFSGKSGFASAAKAALKSSAKDEPAAPPPVTVPSENEPDIDLQLDDFSTVFDDDIDSLIQSALKQDKEITGVSDLDTIDRDFVNETTVFHDLKNSEVDYSYTKPDSKLVAFLKKIPFKVYAITVGVLSFMIVVAVALTVYFAMNNTMLKRIENMPGGMIVYQPKSPINNANYIYVGKGLMFQDEVLSIDKMLIDSMGTVFYFNKKIIPDNYVITLIDDKEKRYAPILSSLQLYNPDEGTSVFYFETLDAKVNYFSLKILDPINGDEVEFYFGINGKIVIPETRYVSASTDLITNTVSHSVYIENMIFSSMGSQLNYSLRWNDDFRVLHLGKKLETQWVSLTEDKRAVTPLVNSHSQYLFKDANLILGHVDFSPVRNLDSSIAVKFTDLYKKFNLQMEVNAAQLFLHTEESEIDIELNEYNFVLERAGWQVNKLILVAHTDNANLYAVSGSSQDYDNRAETVIDVKVRIEKPDGSYVVLDGVPKSSPLGMDVIFDAGDYMNEISGIAYDKYTFEIENVYIKSDDLAFSYDLNNSRNVPATFTTGATTSIIDSFNKRLDYKFGTADVFPESGFSTELAADDNLLKQYRPVECSDPFYSVQIAVFSYIDNIAYAVVKEYWTGTVDGKTVSNLATHQITAVMDEIGWTIVTDEITD